MNLLQRTWPKPHTIAGRRAISLRCLTWQQHRLPEIPNRRLPSGKVWEGANLALAIVQVQRETIALSEATSVPARTQFFWLDTERGEKAKILNELPCQQGYVCSHSKLGQFELLSIRSLLVPAYVTREERQYSVTTSCVRLPQETLTAFRESHCPKCCPEARHFTRSQLSETRTFLPQRRGWSERLPKRFSLRGR